jgi:hypothetical protein
MAGFVAYIWNDLDNTIELLLKQGGEVADLSGVTRMILRDVDGDWEVDENDSASAFDRSATVTGKVTLTLGGEDIPEGRYNVLLIVYDATYTNGIVWDRRGFILNVADLDEVT